MTHGRPTDRHDNGRRLAEIPAAEALVGPAEEHRAQPLYLLIRDILLGAIEDKRLEPGTILLEGPLATLLQSTRTPVRQALRLLEAAGQVARFEGRGYVVGRDGSAARRVEISAFALGLSKGGAPARKVLGWEDIYDTVERSVVQRSLFGRYRISEVELSRTHGVGRLVARDVLLRLEHLGLVEKDERMRWSLVPLTDARAADLYQLRMLLEPFVLREAARHLPAEEVARMRRLLEAAMAAYPEVDAATMDCLESDLHIHTLSFADNKDVLKALARTRPVLMVSKHILGVEVGLPEQEPFMREHHAIFQSLERGDRRGAGAQLKRHIELSLAKVRERMTTFRAIYRWPNLPYFSSGGTDAD